MRLPLLLALTLLLGCSTPHHLPLSEYAAHNASPRQNLPAEYIAYLKQSRFTHGQLDHLPPYAILFHGDPTRFFPSLHLSPGEVTTLDLGTTDISLLYIIRPKDGRAPFLINRAQPGAGGTATQTSELIALGVQYLVHIGTSGLLEPPRPVRSVPLDEHTLALSTASYKDGAAALLSTNPHDPLSHPDQELTNLLSQSLTQLKIPFTRAPGYTIPIYYHQPTTLIESLLQDKAFSSPRPLYLEMEESPFFESAHLGHARAASLTVPSDRYTLDAQGNLTHTFLNDTAITHSLESALRAACAAFTTLAHHSATP